jgi:hypothetical protein
MSPMTNLSAARATAPLRVVRGAGVRIYDDHGNEYLEAMSGLWCTSLGWGNAELADVTRQQMLDLSYYHGFTGDGKPDSEPRFIGRTLKRWRDGAGEWFRPFALTVACSVLVSLAISFTLDPMLSAYWGDPPDHHTAPKGPLGRRLQVFNDWFDHQADRYAGVIAWALHHRRAMGLIALSSLIAAIALHMRYGGSAFLPAADSGNLMIDVRTPASSSLEYARLKMERAAEIARTLPETRETNSNIGPNGGRI